MFPQPKKWPKYLAAAVAIVLLFKAPVTAAHLCDDAWVFACAVGDALTQFATHLAGGGQ